MALGKDGGVADVMWVQNQLEIATTKCVDPSDPQPVHSIETRKKRELLELFVTANAQR